MLVKPSQLWSNLITLGQTCFKLVLFGTGHYKNDNGEVEPRLSKRARIEKSFGPDFPAYMLEGEPRTYKEAVNSTEGLMWKEVIDSEIESILHNHT